MGPFNELRQLERKAKVLEVLAQPNLSDWARNYWGLVYEQIALTEDRYNSRVVSVYKQMEHYKTPKAWWNHG